MTCRPPTLEEVLEYCGRYADTIIVREQVAGKWGDYSLAQLPAEKVSAYAHMWWGQRRLPHRITLLSKPEVGSV
jgi:hypothetical protein